MIPCWLERNYNTLRWYNCLLDLIRLLQLVFCSLGASLIHCKIVQMTLHMLQLVSSFPGTWPTLLGTPVYLCNNKNCQLCCRPLNKLIQIQEIQWRNRSGPETGCGLQQFWTVHLMFCAFWNIYWFKECFFLLIVASLWAQTSLAILHWALSLIRHLHPQK